MLCRMSTTPPTTPFSRLDKPWVRLVTLAIQHAVAAGYDPSRYHLVLEIVHTDGVPFYVFLFTQGEFNAWAYELQSRDFAVSIEVGDHDNITIERQRGVQNYIDAHGRVTY